ncbi:MAG: type III-A CRISPR-associated RAMP protein Csm5 [Deltaproteobacteria bacterium]|nr:type III-A CRISPR-associated RAMP protein Csm5 [Deltaproteobacteria bacterium]
MTEVFKTIPIKLTLASPLHIGCDQDYEPSSFAIDKSSKSLVAINADQFFKAIGDDETKKFSAICQKGTAASLLEIYRFMATNSHHASGRKIAVSESFIHHFDQVLKLHGNRIESQLNQFRIARTSFDPYSGWPIIPGSSVKGALRTAVLNRLNQRKSTPRNEPRDGNRRLQEHLLNYNSRNMDTDPFRLIKVSDLTALKPPTLKIVYAVNIKKGRIDKPTRALYQMVEAVDAGCEFSGTISVFKPPQGFRSTVVDWDKIVDALEYFYGHERKREQKECDDVGIAPLPSTPDNTAGIIRVGFHSGAECVTIDGHREIGIRQKKGTTIKDHTTTFWFASPSPEPHNPKPFGWMYLQKISDAEWKLASTQNRQNWLEVSAELVKKANDFKKAELEAAQKLAEEKARAQEEAKREEEAAQQAANAFAQWENMDAKAKAIASIQGNALYDTAVTADPGVKLDRENPGKVYELLAQFEGTEKVDVARAMKDLWIEQKKWKKKEVSKGQALKVAEIKKILGESE